MIFMFTFCNYVKHSCKKICRKNVENLSSLNKVRFTYNCNALVLPGVHSWDVPQLFTNNRNVERKILIFTG